MRHPIVAILAEIRLGASFVVVRFTICVILITTLMRPTIYMAIATFGEIRGVSLSLCLWLWCLSMFPFVVELGYISICVQSGCCYVANIMLGSKIREVSLSGGVGGVNI